jgi:hypothetical protein
MAESTKRSCKAHRSDGEPCKLSPIKGGEVCRVHGGSVKRTRAAANRRVAIAKQEARLRRYGGPAVREVGPQEAVLQELSWSATHVAALRDLIEDDPSLFDLYGRERDRLTRIAQAASSMGIEERRVALAEEMSASLLLLISRVTNDLPMKYRPVLRRAFHREMRVLTTGDEVS